MAKRGKLNKIKSVATIERPVRSRKYTYYILIVCEDERTEPDYFEKYQQLFFKILPRETIYIRPVGTGRNSLWVVECAKIQREKLRLESGMDVDQTWAVFDKDDLDQTAGNRKNFEDAFAVGEESNINIAYSNECFELWFLLHFDDVNMSEPISREDIYRRLEIAIRHNVDSKFAYVHGDSSIVDIIWEKGNKLNAILRSQELDQYHQRHNTAPIDSNPNTQVYKLVKELDEWYKYYSYEE